MMATQIIYNGTVIGTVTAGQSKILKCNGKKMKSDVEIRAGERTEIKYDGAVIATVEAGNSKTIKCAGKTMKSNIEIRVEEDTPGKEGVSPTVEMIDIDGGTRIIITDVNGPKSADIMDGKDGVDGKDGKDGYTPVKNVDYFDGKDGSDGKNGSDGVSPTVSVSKSGKVTTVTITDKNGTKTATINDGTDGAAGKDGANGKDGVSATHSWNGTTLTVTSASGTSSANLKGDKGDKGDTGSNGSNGVGIKSVVQTTTSSADGGSNVITVTKTDNTTSTFTVKNGSKGGTGAAGKDGTSVTVKSVSESTADGGSNVITFSDGKTLTVKNGSKGSAGKDGSDGRNGADGKTPVKGVDYYTESDKAEIVAAVIESLGGNPIFGIVDENNNIIVNGDLPDGTYTVKYEMEGGKIINIGNLVLDSNVYYTVTKNLTNCTISNSATQIVQGGSYSATITANDGFELKSVSVTMGGSAVSASGGSISIASVTGDIVITAVAEETVVTPSYTNLFVQGGDGYILNGRCSSTGANRTDANGCIVSNYIKVANGDTVYVNTMIGLNFSGFKLAGGGTAGEVIPSGSTYIKNYAESDGIWQFTINNESVEYVRIMIALNANNIAISETDVTNAGIIITVNEPIV